MTGKKKNEKLAALSGIAETVGKMRSWKSILLEVWDRGLPTSPTMDCGCPPASHHSQSGSQAEVIEHRRGHGASIDCKVAFPNCKMERAWADSQGKILDGRGGHSTPPGGQSGMQSSFGLKFVRHGSRRCQAEFKTKHGAALSKLA